jgi:hypothetical protein
MHLIPEVIAVPTLCMTIHVIVEGLEYPLIEGLTHCKTRCPKVPTSILDLAFYSFHTHKLDVSSYLIVPITIREGLLT